MNLENNINEHPTLMSRIRKSLAGKIAAYGLVAGLAFAGGFLLSGCVDDGNGGENDSNVGKHDHVITPEEACADPDDCRLWEAGKVAGVRVGLSNRKSWGGPPLPDSKEREVILAESNLHMNHAFSWKVIWPERNRWNFDPADRAYAFNEDNGLFQAGFHFAWDQEFLDDLPDWVEQINDPDELREVLRERARIIFERYPDLDRINVINEPLPILGTSGEPVENHFYMVLGPDYIKELFEIVDAEAPESVELCLNEAFMGYLPIKAEGLVRLVSELVDSGAPIDTVGFQTHLMFNHMQEPDWDLYRRTMEQVAQLGVKVWISELDVPVDPALEDRFIYQAENYRKAVEACLSVPACTDILIWEVQDTDSYWMPLPYDDPAQCLFDENFEPKPAYFAVRDALLRGRP